MESDGDATRRQEERRPHPSPGRARPAGQGDRQPAEPADAPAIPPVVLPVAAPKMEPVEQPVEQAPVPRPRRTLAPISPPPSPSKSTRKRRERETDDDDEEEVEQKPAVKKPKKAAQEERRRRRAAPKRPKSTRKPTTKDPNLWIIKVLRSGQERAITLQLLRRCIASANKDEPLNIKSIVCKDALKGMLYVEARSRTTSAFACLPRIDYKKKKRAAPQESQSEDEDSKDVELAIFKQALGRKGAKGQRYRRGLLHKIFPLSSVTDENIQPTLEELKIFQEKPPADPEFLEELAKTKIKGDLNVFVGVVQSVEKDGIVMLPGPRGSQETAEAGDHVRITGGKFAGLTGSVVSVDGNVVVVVSDLNLDHMSVRLYDVRLDAQVSTGVDQLGRFHFHDLVTLGENEVGVIVRLERDLIEVLNNQGNLVRVKPNSIQPRGVRMAKAFDSAGNTIQAGDRV
ncbi:DRB sensitivity-inducing factor large subunit [Aphelenchoides fujianensis]|nr:DRB sensitivity-inducing factor large subunit [Aphelenchoides fujianensis]